MSGEEFVRFEAAGLSWTVERAWAEDVRAAVAEPLHDLESRPGVELVKRNLVRTVLKVPLPGPEPRSLIVKRYAVGGPLDWVKYTFRNSRARAEWWAGRALDAAGVPTGVPLGMAERRRLVLRDAALVVEEIPGALHLNAYVEEHLGSGPADAEHRRPLYDDLARVVRRMHEAGLLHNDLHGGNVLVNGPSVEPALHVIDLHSVSRARGPRPGGRWFDLVKLLHSMLTCSTPAERVRFCKVYEEAAGPSETAVTRLLRSGRLEAALEERLARMERHRARGRTVRSLTRSSRFDAGRVGNYRIHHLRAIPSEAFLPLLEAHHRTLAAGGAPVLKDAPRSALTRQVLATPDGERRVVVKQYRVGTLGERIKNALRRPRPITAWLAGNGLLVRHFPAAEPVALLMRGRGIGLREAYIVMADLGEQSRVDLVALARFAGDIPADRVAEKRRLVGAMADLVRHLHLSGVYHADLKAVNLFLDEGPGGPRVVLADYDRVEFDAPVSERRRVKNLAQLSASVAVCISMTDRLRFFRAYAGEDRGLADAWKVWFRQVMTECERKIVVRMQPIE